MVQTLIEAIKVQIIQINGIGFPFINFKGEEQGCSETYLSTKKVYRTGKQK